MTTSTTPTTAHDTRSTRPRRRRLAASLLATALGLGAGGAVAGVITSPGPRTGRAEVAIPGVRGTGGGTGGLAFGISTSPGRTELARKAGGTSPIEY